MQERVNAKIQPGQTFLKMANISSIANLRFLTQKRPYKLPAFWSRCFCVSSPRSTAHEINEPIDEELLPGDRLRCFHPTHPGEVLNGRFKTIAKLGYGAGSTVWLAENLKL